MSVSFSSLPYYVLPSLNFAVDLLGLLKWNSMVGKLKTILVTVMKVSGEEIVKVCVNSRLLAVPF